MKNHSEILSTAFGTSQRRESSGASIYFIHAISGSKGLQIVSRVIVWDVKSFHAIL